MLKKIVRSLLSSVHRKHYGPGPYYGHRKYSSSDHYRRPGYGHMPRHDRYGHGYYKRRDYSSS